MIVTLIRPERGRPVELDSVMRSNLQQDVAYEGIGTRLCYSQI